MVGYWRSLACQAWAHASGRAGGLACPVHLNLAFREPLLPGDAGEADWPESLDGRPDGQPWTSFHCTSAPRDELELPWTERGLVICGDGDYDATALIELAGRAGWPVLAEPSSGASHGPNALSAYQYLLATPEFMAGARPGPDRARRADPGFPARSSALLAAGQARRHVVIAQGPGRWADPQRAATDVDVRAQAHRRRPGSAGFRRGWLAGSGDGRTMRPGARWTPCSTTMRT